MGYVKSAKDEAVASETLVDVYVVDKLVPKGAEAETIKASVSVEHVPARLKQAGAITDLTAVGANVASTDLQPGDQLLAARLVPKDQVSEDVKDKVQISTVLAAERAVGGSLQKGDLVGVYLSFDPFDLDQAGQTTQSTPATDPAAAAISADATSTTAAAPKKSPNMTRLEFQHVLVTNVQTTDAPVSADTKDTKGCRAGERFAVRRHACPVAGAVGALRVRHRVRPRVAVQRAGQRLRRWHTADHPRQRLHGGEVMETNEMPSVIIGHGMSPELAADVSTALHGMGVVVKANGFAPPSRQAKVIVVISPKGGSGKTAVSSNLAVALAQRNPGRVVAVDLDVQFGDLATALALTPEHTLAQLARTTQIDATTVKLFLTPYDERSLRPGRRQRPRGRRFDRPTLKSPWCCPCWRRTSTT